ncbi:MAG TPA: hypothetical protein VK425_08615 [Acidimicrobiales bacterium]|nr:hypothetical protein [Acidimicrobiales bacterium]
MSDPGQKSSAEQFMDLALYAPLGLALTISEAFPQLVRKGRSRLGPQVALARSLGQLALRQGTRQLRDARLPPWAGFPFWAGRWAGTSSSHTGESLHEDLDRTEGPRTSGTVGFGAVRPGRSSAATPASPGEVSAAGLAIPSYDSLSASQVVQRLAGLSREEVEAVRAYEARTRGRRTVLARAEQLLA